MHPTIKESPFVADALRELDAGVNAHTRWQGLIHKALICGPGEVDEAALLDCRFSTWLTGIGQAGWPRWLDEVQSVDNAHRNLHELAERMLLCRRQSGAVAAADYEAFVEQTMHFKLAVRALEFGLISEVCLVDQLTGVWNRSSMMARLSEEYDRMLRTGKTGCLCMMDLDFFKRVNDTHGHVAGDVVLKTVAEIANRCLRRYDSMFRYGGEEFLFCLPNTSPDTAVAAMERVRNDIAASDIALRNAAPVRVTASFGIAGMSPTLELQDCIEEADRALFCAKIAGRNRVCRWDTAN
jgi:diguanylate cyclase (GGDEF)-like protein